MFEPLGGLHGLSNTFQIETANAQDVPTSTYVESV